MKNQDRISSSQEDYLEAIFHIISEKQGVRATDIAHRLNVKNASVTGALRALSDKGLINYAPYDVITLTSEGRSIAEDVIRRHEVLRDFFSRVLGVNSIDAEKGACEMEHSVPKEILDKLIKFVEFLEVCPRAGNEWIEAFSDYCEGKSDSERCILCTTQKLEDLKDRREKEDREGKALITLSELQFGQRGQVIKVRGSGTTHDQIVDKGFSEGSLLEVETRDDQNREIEVKIRGYHVSIRDDDADKVMVELID